MLRIRELRKERKVSQQVLADFLGVTQAALSGWETGRHEIDNANLGRIADYFGVSVDYLLGRSSERDGGSSARTEQDEIFFRFRKEIEPYGLTDGDLDFLVEVYKLHKKKNTPGQDGL